MKMISQIFLLIALALATSATVITAQEVSIPDPALNAVVRETLGKPNGLLTEQDLLSLTNLTAITRNVQNIAGLEAARNLVVLDLQDNRITNFAFPTSLTRLEVLDLSENRFTHLALPGGMTNLSKLRLIAGGITNVVLPPGLRKLSELHLGFNQLTQLILPADLTNLSVLSLFNNDIASLTLPAALPNLTQLDLSDNALTNFDLPTGLTRLVAVNLGGNYLSRFALPSDMTNLSFLRINDNLLTSFTLPASVTNVIGLFLDFNRLTNVTLPPGLNRMTQINLMANNLTNLTLPAGLTNMSVLVIISNQLTTLTFPPDLTQLAAFFISGNPLASLVLSEPLAAAGLASVVDSLRSQGIPIFTYPLTIQLIRIREPIGAFQFAIAGPPGKYSIYDSANLTNWNELGTSDNSVGKVVFTDPSAHLTSKRFYAVRLQTPPSNMVFIAPNTFTMGSATNDLTRSIFEGPPTVVTLTRGFWIGKYEVTQGEYLAVMGENPSNFPGDLSRPVSSVTWNDATNYCARLTQRERAAGRIPAASHFRLPTEAEWECAARAGTSTPLSYGDDPNFIDLKNYAWFLDLGHPDLIVHPVGQKRPNAWGLFDMYGNVWEWCQDWYGEQQGGTATDPTGPPANSQGSKVMRGGAYDYPDSSCRSAARLFFTRIFPDSDLGFRVVLVTDP